MSSNNPTPSTAAPAPRRGLVLRPQKGYLRHQVTGRASSSLLGRAVLKG